MPAELSFTVGSHFDFAQVFAERFHQPVEHNRVSLPVVLGEGYIQEVHLGDSISMCLHQYYLKDELVLNRLRSGDDKMLTVKCTRNGVFNSNNQLHPSVPQSVEISTGNLFSRSVLPGNSFVDFLVVNISRPTLAGLLQLDDESSLLQTILYNPSFVFYETMSAGMERTLLRLQQVHYKAPLSHLQYQSGVYELLFLLFRKLLARDAAAPVQVNGADAEKIYALQAMILSDLGVAPSLPQLARRTGMSETKMKKLFRYVFGQSIYNYFQSARMNEAARLLAALSVSETGQRLGFTNLSHFARLFQKHFGVKPKQYQSSEANRNGYQVRR